MIGCRDIFVMINKLNEPLLPNPVIDAYKNGIDVGMLRRNLKLTVEERLDNLYKLQQFVKELREAGLDTGIADFQRLLDSRKTVSKSD